jgi:glycosyltransferase involved in cell wall biosynthesis
MTRPVVALYAHRLGRGQGTGISVYVRELIAALAADRTFRYHMCGSRESPDDPPPQVDLPVFRAPVPRRVLHAAWTLAGRPAVDGWSGSPDLIHVLYPSCPVPSRAPVIYTFHDLMPLTSPHWYGSAERRMFAAAARDAARRAGAVIANSAWTAKQVREQLGVRGERIHVVPLGVSGTFARRMAPDEVAAVCSRHGVRPGSYVVAVGAVSERKNLGTVIDAIEGSSIELLAIGPVDRSLVAKGAHLTGWLPQTELAALMSGALALVHPSLDEGFGLTPLEAMAAGVPVVVSSAGALPETVQDAALIVDPSDAGAWADAIARLSEDKELRCAMVERGRTRAGAFTWEKAAAETAAVYRSALNG